MKKNVNILDTMNKIPAGTMIIPMIISALINTICQATIKMPLWDLLGNPCRDLFGKGGQMLFCGFSLFITGTMVSPNDFKVFAKRGIWIVLARFIPAYISIFIFYFLFGINGIAGINFLTFACTMCSVNAALFLGTTLKYADNSDTTTFPILLLLMQPLVPYLIISSFGENPASSSAILDKLMQFVSLAIPFVLGFILGNLDEKFRKLFANGNAMVLIFLGIQFGTMMNFTDLFKPLVLLAALLLIVLFYLITSIIPLFVEKKILKRPGYAAAGMCAIAGLALIVPPMFNGWIFNGSTITQEYLTDTIAVLAVVLLLTDLTVPFFQKFVMSNYFKKASKDDLERIFKDSHPELIEKYYPREEKDSSN